MSTWLICLLFYLAVSIIWYSILVCLAIFFYKKMGFKDTLEGYGKSSVIGFIWSLFWPITIPVSLAIIAFYKFRGLKEIGE